MPDFAPDVTFRYKARYLAGGITHDFTVRGGVITSGGEAEAGDLSLAVGQYFAALQGQLLDDVEFLNASWAYANSSIFVPTDAIPPQPAGAIAVAGKSGRVKATATTMAARGTGLGSARLYFYGLYFLGEAEADIGGDTVITSAEFAALTAAKTIADASFRSSDGQVAIFYPRVTVKVNDKTLRLIRRAGA